MREQYTTREFDCRHARSIGTALGSDGLVVVYCDDCRHQFTKPIKSWRGGLIVQHLRRLLGGAA